MRLTVAICTWNRAPLLRQALAALAGMVVPRDVAWELVVVDNNSTDDTATVLAEAAGRLPLRAVFEPTPGKSHALNRAAREARGEYILWTDDDALVDRQWMAAYRRAFERWPEAAVFGGRVEPWFAVEPPAWLARSWRTVASAYAVRDLGDQPIRLDERVVPYGVNMAVRRAEQLRFRYDPALGPRPGGSIRGEETALVREMLRAGCTGWWIPDARVRHFIPAERHTVRYLRSYYEGDGAVAARRAGNGNGRRLFGRPLWLWREAVTAELRYRFHRVAAGPETWLEDLRLASYLRGRLRGHGGQAGA
ncbi:MAG TPA: glycosyltransferase [Gemmatimonadales bacterium]|nr:glycosyltransferase [Gemmatimonadales bacterium]